MNPELMVIVERIVRPVLCSWQRKLRMREELYDLLQQIYAEELTKQPDGEAVLAAATQRLGKPAVIREDLERSRSPFERYSQQYEAFLQSSDLTPWYVMRIALWHTLLFAVPVMLAAEILSHVKGTPSLRLFFLALAGVFGVMSAVALVLGYWAIGKEYRLAWRQTSPGRAWRRLLTGALLMGVSMVPARMALSWAADSESVVLEPLRYGLIVLSVGAVFIAVELFIQREREQIAPWEELVLD